MKPYYAVIFSSTLKQNSQAYQDMAERMENLAKQQDGYMGFESARSGLGISISYWESLEAIANWKEHVEHQEAQRLGKEAWYASYHIRICKVEREYQFRTA